MITACLIGVLLQQQDPTAQLRSVITKPTGRNGYEEYVKACIELKAPAFEEAYRLVLKSPPGTESYLSSRIAAANLGLSAKTLVLAGNAKPVFKPGTLDMDTLFPELSNFRMIARYFATQVTKEFSEGRSNEAGETLLAWLAFADKVSGSGPLINYLVGVSNLATAFTSIDENLSLISLSSWKRLTKRCDELLTSEALLATMRCEMSATAGSVHKFIEHPESMVSVDEVSPGERDTIDRMRAMNARERAAFAQEINARLSSMYQGLQKILVSPESGWLSQTALLESTSYNDGSETLAAYTVSTVCPAYSQTVSTTLRMRAQLRILRLNGLIQIHRWETGTLPASLDALNRPDAVTDPLSGEPFQYELHDDTYDLYSKGTNATGRIGLVYKRPAGQGEDVTPP